MHRRSPPGHLLVAMARYGGQTAAGERHERSDTPVGWVASAFAGVGDSFHPARLGACGAVGHRAGAVLGRADQHANVDGAWPGGALGVLAHVAEYGAWDRAAVARQTTWHRTRAQVWGPCTVPEARARSPNRAETGRAPNGVVLGDVVPGTAWGYLPPAARLSGRQTQVPAGETVQTTTAWAVERWRQAEAASSAPIVGGGAGAYAVTTVVEPCLNPAPGDRKLARLPRRRGEARLYHPVVSRARPKGRRPQGGERLAAPPHHVYGSTSGRAGRAWGEGRRRTCRSKPLRCRWAVSGPEIPVPVVAVAVSGSRAPWFRVTTALDRSAAQVVEACAARVRQADGVRDHTQRLGMEACRAWTKAPGRRTFQGPMVALTLLRLLQCRLDQTCGRGSWWSTPAWYAQKRHGSIRDLCRLFWRHRSVCSPLLVALEEQQNPSQAPARQGNAVSRAA